MMADNDESRSHGAGQLPSDVYAQLARIDAIARVATRVPLPMSLAVCFYFASEAVQAIAGRFTYFSADLSVDGQIPIGLTISVNPLVWILLACSFIINVMLFGMLLAQRSQNRETIRHLAGSKQELEALLDRHRTSSGLTPEGRTHPLDE